MQVLDGSMHLVPSTDERVTLDFARALQQARVAKSWTQKDLATVSSDLHTASCSLS